jgi:hypothetical protein
MKKAMTARCTHKRPVTPGMLRRSSGAFSFANSTNTPAKKKINVIESVTLVAAHDYTKNISELVFSPAVYKRPQTTIGGKVIPKKDT